MKGFVCQSVRNIKSPKTPANFAFPSKGVVRPLSLSMKTRSEEKKRACGLPAREEQCIGPHRLSKVLGVDSALGLGTTAGDTRTYTTSLPPHPRLSSRSHEYDSRTGCCSNGRVPRCAFSAWQRNSISLGVMDIYIYRERERETHVDESPSGYGIRNMLDARRVWVPHDPL